MIKTTRTSKTTKTTASTGKTKPRAVKVLTLEDLAKVSGGFEDCTFGNKRGCGD